MEHKELVGDGCYHVSNTDDEAPSVCSVCERNAYPINEGFAFHLDAKVNNRPSHSVPRLACRQFLAEKMADQGGGDIHGVPCLYLFALPVTHRLGTKERGFHIAGEGTVHGACHERHYCAGLAHVRRQPADTGHRAHQDVASCPKCFVIPGGGGRPIRVSYRLIEWIKPSWPGLSPDPKPRVGWHRRNSVGSPDMVEE